MLCVMVSLAPKKRIQATIGIKVAEYKGSKKADPQKRIEKVVLLPGLQPDRLLVQFLRNRLTLPSDRPCIDMGYMTAGDRPALIIKALLIPRPALLTLGVRFALSRKREANFLPPLRRPAE